MAHRHSARTQILIDAFHFWRTHLPGLSTFVAVEVLISSSVFVLSELMQTGQNNIVALLIVVPVIFIGLWPVAAAFIWIDQNLSNKKMSVLSAYRQGLIRLPSFVVTIVLYTLLVVLGAFALVIPGIIAMFGFSLAYVGAAIDSTTGWTAIKESWTRFKQQKVLIILIEIFALGIEFTNTVYGQVGSFWASLIPAFAFTLIAAFFQVCFVLVYRRTRA